MAITPPAEVRNRVASALWRCSYLGTSTLEHRRTPAGNAETRSVTGGPHRAFPQERRRRRPLPTPASRAAAQLEDASRPSSLLVRDARHGVLFPDHHLADREA